MQYPQADDLTILKPQHSAFHASPLELLLTEMQTRELVVCCGLATDMCVHLTAADAFLREPNPVAHCPRVPYHDCRRGP